MKKFNEPPSIDASPKKVVFADSQEEEPLLIES